MKRVLSTRFFVCLLNSMLIVAALVISPVQASPGILYVAPGGNCGGASPCYGDIQAAVNAAINGDEIRVAAGTYSQVSTGADITSVVRIYNKKITIRGGYTPSDWSHSLPETNPTVIDANNNGVGIFIRYQLDTSYGDVVIDGLSITRGNASTAVAGTDTGGGVCVKSTTHVYVTVQNCKIYDNTAEDGSGGIWGYNTDYMQVLGCEIYDNEGHGVAVSHGSNPAVIDNSVRNNTRYGIAVFTDLGGHTEIRGNEVTGHADTGIRLLSVTGGSLTNNLVSDNHTTGGGGGLDISGATGDFDISGNTIRGNSSLQGGGIDISGSVAQIRNNLIEDNYTTPTSNGGGGLYVDAGGSGAHTLVSGNRVLSNSSTNMGGGMLVLGYVDVLGNTITGNTASSGGGIVATATGTIGSNLISGNRAQIGGGIRTVNAMGLLLERNRVIDNRATNGNGGGMSLWGGFFMDVTLDGNQVISNTASTQGGGIYLECPTGVDPIDISNTVLAGNIAATGSGLYLSVCDANIAYSTVASNGAASGDGIGFYLRDPIAGTAAYTIENSIVVSQTVGIYVQSGSASLEATFWGDGDWSNDADTGGSGTIDPGTLTYQGDPGFVNPTNDDYHILAGFPAVDKGIDTWISVDMDGWLRPSGETDIGADEYVELWPVYLPLVKK